jgi:hypothetical protein
MVTRLGPIATTAESKDPGVAAGPGTIVRAGTEEWCRLQNRGPAMKKPLEEGWKQKVAAHAAALPIVEPAP